MEFSPVSGGSGSLTFDNVAIAMPMNKPYDGMHGNIPGTAATDKVENSTNNLPIPTDAQSALTIIPPALRGRVLEIFQQAERNSSNKPNAVVDGGSIAGLLADGAAAQKID